MNGMKRKGVSNANNTSKKLVDEKHNEKNKK